MSLRVKRSNLIKERDCHALRARNDNVKAFNAFVLDQEQGYFFKEGG
jgi:hypothetical protein